MSIDIRKALRKFLPHLRQAHDASLNEADTVQRLIKFFEDVLGYDPMTDISREAQMKNKFVDIALKVENVVRLLVEAKAGGEKLRDRHIEQAQSYASRNNYHWVVLTNGTEWILYHLTFGDGIEYSRAFSVDLMSDDGLEDAADRLGFLHKQAVKKGHLDEFWEKTTALSPAAIGHALFLEEVLGVLRREIRRQTDVLIDQEDLAEAIHGMLSPEAREQIGPLKIRKRKGVTKRAVADPGGADSETPQPTSVPSSVDPSPPASPGSKPPPM